MGGRWQTVVVRVRADWLLALVCPALAKVWPAERRGLSTRFAVYVAVWKGGSMSARLENLLERRLNAQLARLHYHGFDGSHIGADETCWGALQPVFAGRGERDADTRAGLSE